MAQWDLTAVLAKNLDKHLVFPLLEFLSVKELYPEADIERAKIELVEKTNMVDFLMDIWAQHHRAEPPAEFRERRNAVVEKLNTLQEQADSIVSFLSNANLVKLLKQDKAYNLQLLQEQYNIGPPQIEALYHFAKNKFECGIYQDAAEFLYHYRTLATNADRSLSALWGKLASEILMERWDVATDDLGKLREIIDSNTFAPVLQQLQQRTWLMHWSLYIFFNHENGRNQIIELFLQDRYLNAIQTTSQHLLRYLAVAVIVNKRRRNVMKDLIRIIEQEAYEYSDPVTEFVSALFIDVDFEAAQQKLAQCEALVESDYFLAAMKAEFVENARWFVFETYCRIHRCIDLGMLAAKLGMPREDAERWIVNLIRDARLNAKIDSAAGTVVMGTTFPTAYEQIMDTAKSLSSRTFMLAGAVGAIPRA